MNNKTPPRNNDNEYNLIDIEEQIKESDSEQLDSGKASPQSKTEVSKTDQTLQTRISELET